MKARENTSKHTGTESDLMQTSPKFRRYRDLDSEALNVEFQVHTNQTDGEATAHEVLTVAQQKQLCAIAFTEHVREDTAWFPQFVDEIRGVSRDFPDLKVYVGCETKASDREGRLDVSNEILNTCELVLGSVHRFPSDNGGYIDFSSLTPAQTAAMEFELALGMLRYAPIDVLAHPGGMYERRYGAFPERYFRELMIASLERRIAVEINSSYLVNMDRFLGLCSEINPYVSVGSDAHKLQEIGRCRDILRERGVVRS